MKQPQIKHCELCNRLFQGERCKQCGKNHWHFASDSSCADMVRAEAENDATGFKGDYCNELAGTTGGAKRNRGFADRLD